MKKRYISYVVTLVLVVSIAVSAFATENLNLKVFHGEDDITVFPSTDEDVTISVDSMGQSSKGLIAANNTVTQFIPMVVASQKYDMFCMTLEFFSLDKANINEIYFKIGNTLYQFGKIQMKNTWNNESRCYNETMMFPIDRNSINFMEDFETHRDDSIVVSLVNGEQYIEFELTDDVKNGWLHLYDLYKEAGGTNKDNLDMVWLYNDVTTYNVQTIS